MIQISAISLKNLLGHQDFNDVLNGKKSEDEIMKNSKFI